jgi:DNA polymerase
LNPLQKPDELRQAALTRLRYEQSMGLEILPRTNAAKVLSSLPMPISEPSPLLSHSVPSTHSMPLAPSIPVAKTVPVTQTVSRLRDYPEELVLTPEQRAQRWSDLETRAKNCQSCSLAQTRNTVVFEDGNRQAQLVFVSEGPGVDEDLQGKPFVGQAGQLLNKIISALKLKREDVYLCNVIKCHPPQNRPPLAEEISACQQLLFEQLALIRPKVIVALGGKAANVLLNTQQSIVELRGRWGSYHGIPVMPTYHPAFVLLKYTEENRRTVWDDLKKVLEKLK